jgi:hypothetical protein
MEGMNQFGLKYISTWKCHNETPYTAIFNNKMTFFKNREQEGKAGPFWRLVPVAGERI